MKRQNSQEAKHKTKQKADYVAKEYWRAFKHIHGLRKRL